MSAPDAFGELARYYDPLMTHVNYDRWFFTVSALADLVEEPIRHLDAACGTGNRCLQNVCVSSTARTCRTNADCSGGITSSP